MESPENLSAAAQQYLVHVKGALYRKTPYILALFGDGVGLFDANQKSPTNMWRFVDDGVTVATVPADSDDIAITVRGKASGMQRMMGKTEAETKWVITCPGNRSEIVMRVLSMRDVALGDIPEVRYLVLSFMMYTGRYFPLSFLTALTKHLCMWAACCVHGRLPRCRCSSCAPVCWSATASACAIENGRLFARCLFG